MVSEKDTRDKNTCATALRKRCCVSKAVYNKDVSGKVLAKVVSARGRVTEKMCDKVVWKGDICQSRL